MNQFTAAQNSSTRRAVTDLPKLRWVRSGANRTLSVAAVGTLLASLTVGGAAPAQAAESYARPAGGVLAISGHGFGHGHGMSQWGAYGAAKVGKLSWRSIVAFYYPGTKLANLGNPTIRVRLGAVGTGSLTAFNAPGLRLAGKLLPAKTGTKAITQYRIRSLSAAGKVRIDMRTPTGWSPYPSTAHPAVLKSPAIFSNTSRGAVDVALPSGARRAYRGSIYANRASATTLTSVSVLPMESYLRSVVPLEMSPSWSANALAAQAVAARSYANYGRAHAPAGRTWDTCDNTACQSYSGVPVEYPASNAAVKATAGQTLTVGGVAAFTEFGAANGGFSAAGGQSYLTAHADRYDAAIPNSASAWTTSITAASIQAHWPKIGTYLRLRILSRDGNGQWGGRVLKAAIDGTKGSVTVTGTAFSSAFHLRSQWFVPTGVGAGPTSPVVPPAAAPAAKARAAAPVVARKPAKAVAVVATKYTRYKGVVLRQGSKGAAVVVLQRALKVTADGAFGPKTKAALVAFQTKQHLAPTGVTNRSVWNAIEKAMPR